MMSVLRTRPAEDVILRHKLTTARVRESIVRGITDARSPRPPFEPSR